MTPILKKTFQIKFGEGYGWIEVSDTGVATTEIVVKDSEGNKIDRIVLTKETLPLLIEALEAFLK